MAKRTPKIFSEYMEAIKPVSEFIVKYSFGEDQSFDVRVKTCLTIDEKSTFVSRVANGCFDENDEYHPEYRDPIFQVTALQMLTDVIPFSVKIGEIDEAGELTGKKIDIVDINKTYEMCRCLNLYERVEDTMFQALYSELQFLVKEKIIFKQQQILMGEKKQLERTRTELDNALALINGIAETMNETMGNNSDYNKVLEMSSEFAKRAESMSDPELIRAIMNAR